MDDARGTRHEVNGDRSASLAGGATRLRRGQSTCRDCGIGLGQWSWCAMRRDRLVGGVQDERDVPSRTHRHGVTVT